MFNASRAVAYLISSKYGIYIDASTCINSECEVWINNNSNYTTGCAGSSVSASGSSACNQWNTSVGVNASITGNIYGIYDMSGGAWEYVMGNMLTVDNVFNSRLSLMEEPESKYYNAYVYGNDINDYSRGYLGDATKEVWSWYNDASYFPVEEFPWFGRGGAYKYAEEAGMFRFYRRTGDQTSISTWRVVLTAE